MSSIFLNIEPLARKTVSPTFFTQRPPEDYNNHTFVYLAIPSFRPLRQAQEAGIQKNVRVPDAIG